MVLDDYLEFPAYECDCPDGVDPETAEQSTLDEQCECYTSCGEPVSASCTMRVDPLTLTLSEPDAQCSALEAGEALGLSL